MAAAAAAATISAPVTIGDENSDAQPRRTDDNDSANEDELDATDSEHECTDDDTDTEADAGGGDDADSEAAKPRPAIGDHSDDESPSPRRSSLDAATADNTGGPVTLLGRHTALHVVGGTTQRRASMTPHFSIDELHALADGIAMASSGFLVHACQILPLLCRFSLTLLETLASDASERSEVLALARQATAALAKMARVVVLMQAPSLLWQGVLAVLVSGDRHSATKLWLAGITAVSKTGQRYERALMLACTSRRSTRISHSLNLSLVVDLARYPIGTQADLHAASANKEFRVMGIEATHNAVPGTREQGMSWWY